jgi:hypothetical protein
MLSDRLERSANACPNGRRTRRQTGEGENMARPLLRQWELRERFEIYLTPLERGAIAERAKQAGMPLSAFIRKAALGQKVSALPAINAEQWSKLSGLGSNLNQLAHHANAGTLEGADPATLDELAEQIRQIRLTLMGGSA